MGAAGGLRCRGQVPPQGKALGRTEVSNARGPEKQYPLPFVAVGPVWRGNGEPLWPEAET